MRTLINVFAIVGAKNIAVIRVGTAIEMLAIPSVANIAIIRVRSLINMAGSAGKQRHSSHHKSHQNPFAHHHLHLKKVTTHKDSKKRS